MIYRVSIASVAKRQLAEQASWWSLHRSAEQAARWLDGFDGALHSLAERPERRGLARERVAFNVELRELHYGLGAKPTHRAVFEIVGDEVRVYAVRHLAQRDLTPRDLASD